MKFKIYKLQFNTPVHFGDGNLDETNMTFRSDRLFSSLCIEMLNKYGKTGLAELLDLVKNNKLYLSDAMPYFKDEYFVPKPYISINRDNKIAENDKPDKKNIKKMKYIPVSRLQEFISGDFNDAEEVNKNLKMLGNKNYTTCSVINREDDMATPYSVTSFSFEKNAGLYIVVKFENEESINLINELLIELGISGIGGRRSSGYGKFSITSVSDSDDIINEYDKLINHKKSIQMTISVCLPKKDEIENALDSANYVVIRNGGFVDNAYSINSVKKKNIYYISSGSCFKNSFDGDVYDVSFDKENPIYRYAKPFFLNVGK